MRASPGGSVFSSLSGVELDIRRLRLGFKAARRNFRGECAFAFRGRFGAGPA